MEVLSSQETQWQGKKQQAQIASDVVFGYKRKIVTVRTIKYWKRFPREMVDFPEIFNTWLS